MEKKVGLQKAQTAVGIPKQGQLTQPQAEEILELVYPGVPKEEIVRVAIFCRDYGLHPLAKEVFIVGYKNTRTGATDYSMLVGIPANRKIAHNLKGAFSFLDDTPRAATKEEIERQFGEDSDEVKDNLISITKLKGETGNLAIGFGLYPKSENPKGMAKGNTRRNMCNIRSERQAMDRLPGSPMPKDVDVIDAEYVVVPEVGKVKIATGEITEKPVEGEVVEEEPVELFKTEPESTEPQPDDAKDHSLVTKAHLLTIQKLLEANNMGGSDLQKWCNSEPRNWKIGASTELQVWQYQEIKEAFKKAGA